MRPIAGLAGLLAAALIVLPACRRTDREEADPTPSGDLPQIVRADLSDLRPELATQVEDAWRRVEEMADTGYPDRGAAAAAVGSLAHLYFAFDLLTDAESAYSAAETLDPDNPDWPYYVGLVREARVDSTGSLAAFQRAAELDPDDVPARIRFGNALLAVGEPARARGQFAAALAQGGDLAAVHYGLGQASARAGEVEQAIAELETALAMQPGATVIHYQLAQQYQKAGDIDAAQRHLARSGQTRVIFPDPRGREVARHKVTTAFEVVQDLARDPDGLSVDNILGFAIVRFGDVGGALAAFSSMLEGRQDRLGELELSRAYWVLGALQARQNDNERAIESLERALAADPDFVPASTLLASRLARVGRDEEALARLDQILESDPENRDALLSRAAVRIDSGLTASGLEDLERLVVLEPTNSEGWIRIAGVHERSGRFDAALAAYRTAQDLPLAVSDRVLTHIRSAGLLTRLDRNAEAETELARALQLEPGAPDARAGMAALRSRAGDLEGALKIYREVEEETPGHRTAWVGEARLLILAGRQAEASERLSAGLRALPDDPVLMLMLARQLAASPDRSVRDGRRAVELSTSLLEASPTAEAYETLAMALAEDGRFEEAIEVQERLLARDHRMGGASSQRLESNLALYRDGTTCCAPPPSDPR